MVLFCLGLLTLSASSQSRQYTQDSINAQQLIDDKLKHLEAVGVVNYLYLFSDAGSIVILYEVEGRIKGSKSYYKRGSDFRNLKLSRGDKVNYTKCIEMARMDTIVGFSNCNDFVYSFNRVTFLANAGKHSIKGTFTSDCKDAMSKKAMRELYDIYNNILVFK